MTCSDELRLLSKQCDDIVSHCLKCTMDKRKYYLQKICEFSESLFNIIAEDVPCKEFANYKYMLHGIVQCYSKESLSYQSYCKITQNLGEEVVSFFEKAKDIALKFREDFKSPQFLTVEGAQGEDDAKLRDFCTYVRETFVSVKKFEERIQQLGNVVASMTEQSLKKGAKD